MEFIYPHASPATAIPVSDIVHEVTGIPRTEFVTTYLGRAPVHVRMAPHLAVPQMSEFGDLLALSAVDVRDIQLSKAGSTIPTPMFKNGRLDLQAIWSHFYSGVSIVFNNVQRIDPRLKRLFDGLSTSLAMRGNINAYLTPTDGSAFTTHYDTHDVIIIQAFGAKRWNLFERPDVVPEIPLWHQRKLPPEQLEVKPLAEFTMVAGDALYIPSGIPHRARTDSGASLHYTIGLSPVDVSEVLTVATEVLRRADAQFRRPISPDLFSDPGYRIDPAVIKAVCDRLCEESILTSALQTIRKRTITDAGMTVRPIVDKPDDFLEEPARWRQGVYAETLQEDSDSVVISNGLKATSFTGVEKDLYLRIKGAGTTDIGPIDPGNKGAYRTVIERLSVLGLIDAH